MGRFFWLITLLDEARQPVATWTLRNAQPRKWTGPEFDALGDGLAFEEIEFTYEKLEWL